MCNAIRYMLENKLNETRNKICMRGHRKRKKLQSTKLLRNDDELVGTGRVEDLGIA